MCWVEKWGRHGHFSCLLGKSALGCAGCIFPPYTAPLTFQVDIVSTLTLILSYFDVYNVLFVSLIFQSFLFLAL